jgi:acetyl-CoA C-acetyltransferase
MAEAVIVSTARTPIGKAYRGAFNNTHGATLTGHVVEHAVQRARLDPAEVEDVIIGCAMPEGATGHNIARQAALRAGLPVTAAATTVNRFCSSGLQAIAIAAQRVIVDRVPVAVAGGVESISLVQNEHQNRFRLTEDWLLEHKPEVYMSMLETAEIVAKRYGVTREAQDRYALESQHRIAAAQREGRLDAEIVPLKSVKIVTDKATGQTREESVTLTQDEGNRADTTAEGLATLKPVVSAEGTITAGNASQLSDGASACVVMDARLAERRGLAPLGIFRGLAVAGCEPDEMGIGPVFAVPRLLERHGLKVDDIDLWELNEAFAVQVVYCRDRLGIPMEKLNVDGGSIAIGHPYGMSGARMTGHARQLAHASFRRGVRHDAGARQRAHQRGDVHDLAALARDHAGQHGLRHDEGRGQIGGDDVVPILL